VTAYDKYALKAFDVHAIDYLLKPFDKDRFKSGLAKARQQLEKRPAEELERRLLELVQDLRPSTKMDRFVIKSGGRVFFIRAEEIDWIEAAGNYVKLHVGNEAHLFRETMNALEARLNPALFYRIHRSHIVNIERVRELQPWFNGEYVVFLKDNTRLTLSRGYREKLQERIGRSL
jgi:two-component system LytT family response regulator